MNDPLLAWRSEFPILADKTYLINNSLGAMPASVPAALREYTDLWAAEGVTAWDRWLPMVAEVSSLLEDLLRAPPGSLTMFQNVTNALAALLSCLEYEPPRTAVIHASAEFPTVEYLLDAQRRYGATVRRVGADPLSFPLQAVLESIDERTLLVVVSHVLYRTAEMVDLGPIVDRAHEAGALVVLDAYQSVGAVPIDVEALGVDALVGGSVKWLCGGPGAGYLWARPSIVERLAPAAAGWFSHERPFAFEPPPIRFAPGISRFIGGTPNVPALYQAREGYRIIREVGIEAIRAKGLAQGELLMDRAKAAGLLLRTPAEPGRRGNHVTVDFPGSELVKEDLLAGGFVVDHRPGAGIRIAPHFYNGDDECEAVIEAIGAARSRLSG